MDTDEVFQKNEKNTSVSTNSDFTSRQKKLFEQLDKVGGVINTDHETQMDIEPITPSNKRKRSETKQFRGKESLFKRPELPISKCLPMRRAPDFQRNPHKWTKYSLDDVSSADMSEQSNTTAALSFLRELEERKSNEEDEKINLNSTKITFKKRIPKPQNVSTSTEKDDEDKLVFKGSKIVMPEYVIGQKKPIKKDKKTTSSTKNRNEIKLDHLQDEDDEQE